MKNKTVYLYRDYKNRPVDHISIVEDKSKSYAEGGDITDEDLEMMKYSQRIRDIENRYSKLLEAYDQYDGEIPEDFAAEIRRFNKESFPYIGGYGNEPRIEYLNRHKDLVYEINKIAKRYGINPNIVINRMAKEGFIDDMIRKNNDAYANDGMIDPGLMLYELNIKPTDINASSYNAFGLDSTMGDYLDGKIRVDVDDTNEFNSSMSPIGDRRNESGLEVHDYMIPTKNAIHLYSADLLSRRKAMKDAYPDFNDDELDAATNAAFNRGVEGAKRFINNNPNWFESYSVYDWNGSLDKNRNEYKEGGKLQYGKKIGNILPVNNSNKVDTRIRYVPGYGYVPYTREVDWKQRMDRNHTANRELVPETVLKEPPIPIPQIKPIETNNYTIPEFNSGIGFGVRKFKEGGELDDNLTPFTFDYDWGEYANSVKKERDSMREHGYDDPSDVKWNVGGMPEKGWYSDGDITYLPELVVTGSKKQAEMNKADYNEWQESSKIPWWTPKYPQSGALENVYPELLFTPVGLKLLGNPLVQGVFGAEGAYHLLSDDGIRKTFRKMTDDYRGASNDDYTNGDIALSALGDAFDAAMIGGGISGAKKIYDFAKPAAKKLAYNVAAPIELKKSITKTDLPVLDNNYNIGLTAVSPSGDLVNSIQDMNSLNKAAQFIKRYKEFAGKYGYDIPDIPITDIKAWEEAAKRMLDRHHTFLRGVSKENALKEDWEAAKKVLGPDMTEEQFLEYAATHPRAGYDELWLSPSSNADIYGAGRSARVQVPYELGENRLNWFSEGDLPIYGYKTYDRRVLDFDTRNAERFKGMLTPWNDIDSKDGITELIYKGDKPLIFKGYEGDYTLIDRPNRVWGSEK